MAYAVLPCRTDSGDTLTLAIQHNPTANAGSDDTICENSTYTLSGTATNDKSVAWTTLGDGSFDDATSLTAAYTPGANDISVGNVKLTLTAYAVLPCGTDASDTLSLNLAKYPDKPTTPVGPEIILFGQDKNSVYTTNQVNHAQTYFWYLSPNPDVGTISSEDTTGTVTWNESFTNTKAYVYVSAQNDICGTTSSDSLEIGISPMGVPDANSNKLNIRIAPNPSQGEFKVIINNAKEDIELTVLNQSGQVVKQLKLINTPSKTSVKNIYLTNYPAGIYFLRFVGEQSLTVKRVVIK